MTRDEVHALVMAFPQVEEGTSYGYPSYKVFGKFFTRVRAQDLSLVIGQVGFDEREMLLEVEPQTFHCTDHYKAYPYVLARIASVDPDQLRGLLERQWRKNAPKRWLKEHDAARA